MIKLVEIEEVSSIILPEGVKSNKEIKAVIVAVADDCECGLEVGHEVLVKAGADRAFIPIPGDEKLLLLPESQVAAIMNYEEEVKQLADK